jgi:hypothetical protein
LITYPIPDLDLGDLSLWLTKFKGGPIVFGSLCATISTILQSELVLNIEYFIDSNKVIVVVELLVGWEVSVLLAALEWCVRIGISYGELDSLSLEITLITKAKECNLS